MRQDKRSTSNAADSKGEGSGGYIQQDEHQHQEEAENTKTQAHRSLYSSVAPGPLGHLYPKARTKRTDLLLKRKRKFTETHKVCEVP